MSNNSAYRKILSIMGRGRKEYGSVPEHLRGKIFEFPSVSKSLSKKDTFPSFVNLSFQVFCIFIFTIKDQKNLRFRISDTCDFSANGRLERKDRYLIDRGAYLFEQLVISNHGKNNSFRIFSLKELQKATNNFSADLILSDYLIPTYRGIIEDRHVAVKIVKWFLIGEVVSLSLIKHRNVVKLLGCCLETEFPIVVHELPPNGKLRQHILYEEPPPVDLLWKDRLRIATEITDAVAYLHSELHMTHGSLSAPEAVLLDEFHSAKLSAFDNSMIKNPAESSDETDIILNSRNKVRKREDVYAVGCILLNLLSIETDDRSEFTPSNEKVEILKYLTPNVSEKEMPQIEAYVDLLLRCLSLYELYECVPSIEEVARESRRIRSM